MVILDLMLPGIDGLEVCRKLKADTELAHIAIVIVTAKGEEADITMGLTLGADDYMTKPFSPKELVARVQAVLRRTKSDSAIQKYIKIDALTIDLYKHEVPIKNESIPLTLAEFKLLHQLASKPGRVFTRDQLLDTISGHDTIVIDRTIDVHVASLRKKLQAFANRIITIRGMVINLRNKRVFKNKIFWKIFTSYIGLLCLCLVTAAGGTIIGGPGVGMAAGLGQARFVTFTAPNGGCYQAVTPAG